MQAPRLSSRLLVVLMIVGALSAIGTAWAGVVLADIYRPHAPGVGLESLPAAARSSDAWSDWHLRATLVFLVSTIVAALAVPWHLQRATRVTRHRAVVPACSIVAFVTALVTLLTQRLVEWDQLALHSVTIGSNLSGYWFAAFGDDLRYVLVNNTEVSQGRYVPALLVHLGAPMVGAAVLVVAVLTLFRSSRVPG